MSKVLAVGLTLGAVFLLVRRATGSNGWAVAAVVPGI
jgi:hypothetical protein